MVVCRVVLFLLVSCLGIKFDRTGMRANRSSGLSLLRTVVPLPAPVRGLNAERLQTAQPASCKTAARGAAKEELPRHREIQV